MKTKEPIENLIEELEKAANEVDEFSKAAEEVMDAAEKIGKEAGGILTRIKNALARLINYIKGLFTRKG